MIRISSYRRIREHRRAEPRVILVLSTRRVEYILGGSRNLALLDPRSRA